VSKIVRERLTGRVENQQKMWRA